jgi:hypothetical protein
MDSNHRSPAEFGNFDVSRTGSRSPRMTQAERPAPYNIEKTGEDAELVKPARLERDVNTPTHAHFVSPMNSYRPRPSQRRNFGKLSAPFG